MMKLFSETDPEMFYDFGFGDVDFGFDFCCVVLSGIQPRFVIDLIMDSLRFSVIWAFSVKL